MRSMIGRHRDGSGPHATDRGVDGVNATRSVAPPGSSPEAAQRCAEGAGLDAGGAHRSTIKRAVTCGPPPIEHNPPRLAGSEPPAATPQISTRLTDVTHSRPSGSDRYPSAAALPLGRRPASHHQILGA